MPIEKIIDLRFLVLAAIGLAWLYRGWRAQRTLMLAPVIVPPPSAPGRNEKISVLIPAKNEEKNIGACVDGLLAQDYPNYEIIVINDNSTDGTAEILKGYEDRIQVLHNQPTPPGWTGKNFALQQGFRLASGSYLLFTDADTRHEPHSLSHAFGHMDLRDLRFLTLLPKCLAGSFMEWMIQPFAMAMLGLWFPIEKINNPHSRVAFANGQYLMIERKLYEKIGGHSRVRGEFLEDFALMKEAKERNARAECAFGMSVYGTRMYDSLAGMWRGWRRIYLHAFKRKPAVLFSRFMEVLALSILPFTVFAVLTYNLLTAGQIADHFLWQFCFAIILVILGISWRAFRMVRAKSAFAVLHPLAAFFVSMFLWEAFWMAVKKEKTVWR